MDQLTIGHPRWQEFVGRLEQRLDFREHSDKPGTYEWRCGKGEDRFAYAREVLTRDGPPTGGFPGRPFSASGRRAVTARPS